MDIDGGRLERREFLRRAGRAVGVAVGAAAGGLPGVEVPSPSDPAPAAAGVAIVRDPADAVAASPPARWAVDLLAKSLAVRGVPARAIARIEEVGPGETAILAAGARAPAAVEALRGAATQIPGAPESLGLVPGAAGGRPVLLAAGSDARGLAYAVLELRDRVECGADALAALAVPRPIVQEPANRIRSIARAFVSEVEDRGWFHDRAFWERYLTELIAQRFNRFALTFGIGYDFTSGITDAYFHFAYPFLVAVPGRDVRASDLPDAERDRNLEALRWISEAAAARGLHFQLGLWTHAYRWTDSPRASHTIEGLTPEIHAAYCRDALRALLAACPAIAGVTLRVHGESGIAEGSYGFWRTVLEGVSACGRTVEIDLHAKGMDAEMIRVALATGMPVNISPKYWAEHMGLPYHQAAIRDLEMPPRDGKDGGFFAKSSGSRRFLRYGYGDLLAEDRRHGVLHRLWPGTQRLLLWGDPWTAAAYGRASSFCGSAGTEICEPLFFKGRKGSGLPGGRDAYADPALRPPGGDWEKYLYTYRLWGRLLYDPGADPETWRRFLARRFGAAAAPAEAALASASRILPLVTTAHLPSAANNGFWPEIYTNMPVADARRPHPYGDTPAPRRFGAVSPLDPELFSRIDDFAGELVSGERSWRRSPLEVARWLDELAATAADCLAKAEKAAGRPDDPEIRRAAIDIGIQAGLGRFFAGKLRAGVLHALFERGAGRPALEGALREYRAARDAWAALARLAGGAYVRDIAFGPDPHLRGSWGDRLAAIDADIADLEKLLAAAEAAPADAAGREDERAALREALDPPAAPTWSLDHYPPRSFRRGEAVAIEAGVAAAAGEIPPASVRLHYRRLNQAETWRIVDMEPRGGRWAAAIPAACADSPFPLQYFFEARDARGRARALPGIDGIRPAPPYFVVRLESAIRT